MISAAIAALPTGSCLIDGEAIVTDEAGLAVFELPRSWRHNHAAVLCAFDLIELDAGAEKAERPRGRAKPSTLRQNGGSCHWQMAFAAMAG